jgi:hypothetical protein
MRRLSVVIFSVSFLAYGLWAHDWTTIIASAAMAAVWPFIASGVLMERERAERELLDRLWDDDDLSESA